MFKNNKLVNKYIYGSGCLSELPKILGKKREPGNDVVAFIIDEYFKDKSPLSKAIEIQDEVIFVETSKREPTTLYVNEIAMNIKKNLGKLPCALVGLGGGSAMDICKGVSNLLTNEGFAEDYQGWDLVPNPGVYKVGVPSLSGSGAEATRTCVMINPTNGLKLGMNSDHTVFDQIILDPTLTGSVPRDQYFWSGMDSYIHCVEALAGKHRNAIGDSFSHQTIKMCREVFNAEDMQSLENREKLMVASYLGGCAIATSYVGVIHPFSAGLSVVLGTPHCLANCIVMGAMEEFYPESFFEFKRMREKQKVEVPTGICKNLTEDQYKRLFNATVIHEKPLINALGENFQEVLTYEKVVQLFKLM